MSFDVLWSPAAEAQLARFWLAAEDRSALTEAANKIDRLLMEQPEEVGESRTGRNRILFSLPLVAFYEVDSATQRVIVRRLRHLQGSNG